MRALVTQSGPSLPQVSRLEAIGTPPSLSIRRVANGSTWVTTSTALASNADAIDSVSLNHTMLKSLYVRPALCQRAVGHQLEGVEAHGADLQALALVLGEVGHALDAARALRDQEQAARAAAADDAHRRAVVRRDDDVGERDVDDVHHAAGQRGERVARVGHELHVDLQPLVLEDPRGLRVEQRRHADADQVADVDHVRHRLGKALRPTYRNAGDGGGGLQELAALHGGAPFV